MVASEREIELVAQVAQLSADLEAARAELAQRGRMFCGKCKEDVAAPLVDVVDENRALRSRVDTLREQLAAAQRCIEELERFPKSLERRAQRAEAERDAALKVRDAALADRIPFAESYAAEQIRERDAAQAKAHDLNLWRLAALHIAKHGPLPEHDAHEELRAIAALWRGAVEADKQFVDMTADRDSWREQADARMTETLEAMRAREEAERFPKSLERRAQAEQQAREKIEAKLAQALEALAPLVAIANAYDANALDDEARKLWGANLQHENKTPPGEVELYCGRGGKRLLTLADCFAAREALRDLSPESKLEEPERKEASGSAQASPGLTPAGSSFSPESKIEVVGRGDSESRDGAQGHLGTRPSAGTNPRPTQPSPESKQAETKCDWCNGAVAEGHMLASECPGGCAAKCDECNGEGVVDEKTGGPFKSRCGSCDGTGDKPTTQEASHAPAGESPARVTEQDRVALADVQRRLAHSEALRARLEEKYRSPAPIRPGDYNPNATDDECRCPRCGSFRPGYPYSDADRCLNCQWPRPARPAGPSPEAEEYKRYVEEKMARFDAGADALDSVMEMAEAEVCDGSGRLGGDYVASQGGQYAYDCPGCTKCQPAAKGEG